MSSTLTSVPKDPDDLRQWATDAAASNGFPPLAGGEAQPGEPPAAAPPAPAAPAPQVAPPGQPAPPPDPQVAAPPAAPSPSIEDVYAMLEERLPAGPPDPLEVELGLQPAPVDPGLPPQAQPGTAFPGQPPAQQPGVPQQPQPGVPGPQQAEVQAVERWINDMVEQRINESVLPRFEEGEKARRQNEFTELRGQHPELADPNVASALVKRAQNWATQVLGNSELAREPAFLEMVLLAGAQMDANQAVAAQQPGTPGTQPQAVAPPPGVPIEAPGGAALPAGQLTPEQQTQQAILAAGGGSGLDPFWRGGL